MALTFAWIAVVVIACTATGLLLTRDWRWSIILLAVQYMGVFVLTLQHWPLGMASVKVVAGWMSAAILGNDAARVSPNRARSLLAFGRVGASSVCLPRAW